MNIYSYNCYGSMINTLANESSNTAERVLTQWLNDGLVGLEMLFAWPWYAFHWFLIACVLLSYGEDMLPPKDNASYKDLDWEWKEWYHELSIDTQVTMLQYVYEKVGETRDGTAIYEIQFEHFADASFPYWNGHLLEKIVNHSFMWLFLCLAYAIIDFVIIMFTLVLLAQFGVITTGFGTWFSFGGYSYDNCYNARKGGYYC